MNFRTLSLALFMSAIIVSATTSQSVAHAILEVQEAAASSYYKAVVRIGHGCDGKATQNVRVTIPEGIISVKPMPKAGWTLSVIEGDYENTYALHKRKITSGVTQINWSGELSNSHYDEFVFRAYLSDKLPAGKTVYIPVVQECGDSQVGWTQIPAEGQDSHDLSRPAPGLMISSAHNTHAGSHAMAKKDDKSEMAMMRHGDLEISTPYARATVPNAPVAGGYLTIHNKGSVAERLLGGSASFAGKVEIHEMAIENDIMKMRPLSDGLEIPAGATITLKPGSYHVMFMQLQEQLIAGQTRDVILQFEKAGEVSVPFLVQDLGSSKKQMDHSKHGHSN